MAVVLGAIKGIWRAALLLVVAVLVPAIAMLAASYTHESLGLDFTVTFLLALGLEALLGVVALFGIASEVQQSHSETIDPAAQEQASK